MAGNKLEGIRYFNRISVELPASVHGQAAKMQLDSRGASKSVLEDLYAIRHHIPSLQLIKKAGEERHRQAGKSVSMHIPTIGLIIASELRMAKRLSQVPSDYLNQIIIRARARDMVAAQLEYIALMGVRADYQDTRNFPSFYWVALKEKFGWNF